MKRIISGITATGNLTIGNYLGAIKALVQEQNNTDNELFIFVADLHGLSIPIDPKLIKNNIKEIIKIYLAAGLNPKRTNLFIQSQIIGHTELFYLLSTITNIGQLERMTQFKDKSLKNRNKTNYIPSGILIYPILMVADIMLYNPEFVIVGQDQKQHLELTKNLVSKMNKNYHLNFNLPEAKILKNEEGSKIMALQEPNKKMSKSDLNLNNTIFLLDPPDLIRKKIMQSITDSENKIYYNLKEKPGISNLLTIYANFANTTITEIEIKFKDSDYKTFKKSLADLIIGKLESLQNNYKTLTDSQIKDALAKNHKKIQEIAFENLNKVMKKMGILN